MFDFVFRKNFLLLMHLHFTEHSIGYLLHTLVSLIQGIKHIEQYCFPRIKLLTRPF